MFIKSCEPPPVYQISTIGRLEILHLSKRCEGQCRKGLSAEDASNAYHSFIIIYRMAAGMAFGAAPKEPRAGFTISESTSLLIAFRSQGGEGWAWNCIYALLS